MEALDRHVVEWLAGLDWPVVTPLMKGFTYAGGAGAIWIVIGAAAAVRLRRPLVFVVLVVSVRLSAILDGVLKRAIGRQRPPLADPRVHPLIPLPHDPSMPSGHAMMAFTGAVFLAAVVPRFRWALLALAAAIGLSRVYLGVHYPSDVLVGALLGAAIGAVAIPVLGVGERALRSWRTRSRRRDAAARR
ncbi:MAG TPA: phosphatase PAP2 family protein [Gaiellales bacterium]